MNKKAIEIIMENIIFFILILIFFAAMFYFVNRASKQVSIAEQIYAKQLAITIDKMKPGTEVILDISELYDVIEEKDYEEHPVIIDNIQNKVIVQLVSGKGYEYEFFNRANILWSLEDRKLYLEAINDKDLENL